MNLERASILACLAVATVLAATIVGCNNNNGTNPGARVIAPSASSSPAQT